MTRQPVEPMTESAIIRALFLEGADLDLDHPHGRAMAYDIAARILAKTVAVHDYASGNDAMRAVADEPPFSDEPFHEQIAQTIAARKARPFKIGDRVRISDECIWRGAPGGVIAKIDDDPSGCNLRVDLDSLFQGLSRLWAYPEMLAHAEAIPTETPQEAEQLDEIEARQIDRAHPAVFDLAGFAADSLGLKRGA